MIATLDSPVRRGDLSRTRFAELFEQVAATGGEQRLRVWDAVEQYQLFFSSGSVQIWSPERPTRRLGQRLVARGWLHEPDLTAALQAQKLEDRPLGALLVERGLVTQQQVDETAQHQLSEDLYALFTWKQGDFELGPAVRDEHIAARLLVLPAFDCRQVRVEVARREAEWAILQQRIYSVDEMFVARSGCDRSRLDQRQRRVLDALDGRLRLREVAEVTMLSTFECACALRDLLDMQCVDLANAVDTLQTARSCIARGDRRTARTILQQMIERPGEINQDMMLEVAEMLRNCGASRLAADAKLVAARIGGHSDAALDLAWEACRENPRSIRAWAHLRHELIDRRVGGEQLEEASLGLVDALIHERRAQDALRILDELETAVPAGVDQLQRRVLALHKLGRAEEEIELLLELAAIYENEGDRERLADAYAHVLRLDGSRRDIARALAELQPGPIGSALRGLRRLSVAAVGVFRRREQAAVDDDFEQGLEA